MFLDLTTGEQERRAGGGSLSNTPEAVLAINVYLTLKRAFGNGGGNPGAGGDQTVSEGDRKGIPGRVGVISPYAQQVSVLRKQFQVCVRACVSVRLCACACIREGSGSCLGICAYTSTMCLPLARFRTRMALHVTMPVVHGSEAVEI